MNPKIRPWVKFPVMYWKIRKNGKPMSSISAVDHVIYR